MINSFLDYITIERRMSPKTAAAYKADLEEFCTFLQVMPETLDVTRVTEEDIKEWVIHLMDVRHNAPRSVKQKIAALHSFYKYLLRIGKVQKDVTLRVIVPKVDKPLPVFFKPSEMQLATEYEDKADDKESVRDNLIIEMLYQTGMRQAEMLGLKDDDVDTRTGQIRVFGKRSKERLIPIGTKLIQMIENYREYRDCDNGMFFVHWKKNGEIVPLSKFVLYKIVTTRMGEVSTLKKRSPHVLRHTFATTMLNNGADIRTIQTLLGHKSLAATQIYTHSTIEQIKKIYNEAHPRAVKNKEEKL